MQDRVFSWPAWLLSYQDDALANCILALSTEEGRPGGKGHGIQRSSYMPHPPLGLGWG